MRERSHGQIPRTGKAWACAATVVASGAILLGCARVPWSGPTPRGPVPSSPSLAGERAFIEGFAVDVQGVQRDNWVGNAVAPCAGRQWGGEVVKITSTEPALLTVFDVPSAGGQLAGLAPVGLHLAVSRMAGRSVAGCGQVKNRGFAHCGDRSFDVSANLSYSDGRVGLLPQGVDPAILVASARFDAECTDWAERAFGLPTTTLSVENSDHSLASTSGSVSGALSAVLLLSAVAPKPAVTVTGNAVSHASDGLLRRVGIRLEVRFRRLYSIRPWIRDDPLNCAAVLALIPGPHIGQAGYSDEHLQWDQVKFSEIKGQHGSEKRIEAVRMYVQNGGPGVLLPDWTNVRSPQDVSFWQSYMTQTLRHEAGRVRLLADFLKANSRTYVVTASGSAATGDAADLLLLKEDAKLRQLTNELSVAQRRYNGSRQSGCP